MQQRRSIDRTLLHSALILATVLALGFAPAAAAQEDPQICGGIQGQGCPSGQFCELPAGECDSADLQGICVEIPGACTQEFKPVCACDGKTYGNDCERQRAGVQKDHDGECKR